MCDVESYEWFSDQVCRVSDDKEGEGNPDEIKRGEKVDPSW